MLKKNQCRVIIASGLMVGASMMVAGVAKANTTAQGDVSGQVAAISNIAYAQPAANQALSSTGTSTLDFGTVNVQNNSATGWTVTVDSANDGVLKLGTAANAPTIAYSTITASTAATGAPTGLTSDVTGATPVNLATTPSLACASTGGCDYTLSATAVSANGQPAGIYTDTLTFTISTP